MSKLPHPAQSQHSLSTVTAQSQHSHGHSHSTVTAQVKPDFEAAAPCSKAAVGVGDGAVFSLPSLGTKPDAGQRPTSPSSTDEFEAAVPRGKGPGAATVENGQRLRGS